jgi:hypothetical protein
LALCLLEDQFAIVRLDPARATPAWAQGRSSFTAVVRTAAELSVVAPQEAVPAEVEAVGPWRVLEVQGPLDFGLTGILADLAGILARIEISIFAVSTYDTDYVLVREEDVAAAIEALRAAGHAVAGEPPACPAT